MLCIEVRSRLQERREHQEARGVFVQLYTTSRDYPITQRLVRG